MYWVKYIRYGNVFSAHFSSTKNIYEFLCILENDSSVQSFKLGTDASVLTCDSFGWGAFTKSTERLYDETTMEV